MDEETQKMVSEDKKLYWTTERIIASWIMFIILIGIGLGILSLFGYLTIYVPIDWARDVVNGVTDCHHFFGLLLCIK